MSCNMSSHEKGQGEEYAPLSLSCRSSTDSNLSFHDVDLERKKQEKPSNFRLIRILNFFVKTTIIGFAIQGVISLASPTMSQTELAVEAEPISCNCGNSIEEAIAMGCKYDSLSSAWLPDACRDDELTAEFESIGDGPNGNWRYYADWEATIPLNLTEVGMIPKGQFFTTTHEWHIAHCTWIWLKQFRASKGKVVVEGRNDREEHIRHCHQMYLKRDPLDSLTTGSGVTLMADVYVKPKHHEGH